MKNETKLLKFKRLMEPAKEIYTKELKDFSKKYNSIGNMTLTEDPDIDTMDYLYSFEKLNGITDAEADSIHSALYAHMKKFSKEQGIYEYYLNSVISLRG